MVCRLDEYKDTDKGEDYKSVLGGEGHRSHLRKKIYSDIMSLTHGLEWRMYLYMCLFKADP